MSVTAISFCQTKPANLCPAVPLRSLPHVKAHQRNVGCHAWWSLRKKKDLFASEEREQELVSSNSVTGSESQKGRNSITEDRPSDASEYVIQNIRSLDQVSSDDWNSCLTSSAEENPFLLYQFLNALEQSGSATRFTGWMPYHLIMRRKADNKLVGCCPLYVKSHSYGEYVFDHQWAQISAFSGIRYYPKLQCCVPFTPVPGSRLLVNAEAEEDVASIKKSLSVGIKAVADSLGVSSAHLTFNSEEEQTLLGSQGYIGRTGLQYHWENNGYSTFDEFLMELKQSKRKSIRQERKCVGKADLKVERLFGDDIKSHHWDMFFEFYTDTCDRKYGDPYLNREFFHMLGETMGDRILLVLAKTNVGDYVAGAWNCIGSHALFGRNWGKRRYFQCKNLHFELCYYQAIEAAIELGLGRVEAGAQGEHKIQRGYLPKATFSSHYIRQKEVRKHIQRITDLERIRVMEAIEYMQVGYSPFK